MADRKKKKAGGLLIGPALIVAGCMALWQNEGRFDYYTAARDATVITSPIESPVEPIAYTARLRTDIPIEGDYVTRFDGYLVVNRQAEI